MFSISPPEAVCSPSGVSFERRASPIEWGLSRRRLFGDLRALTVPNRVDVCVCRLDGYDDDDYDDYGGGANVGGRAGGGGYGELDPPTPPPASADGHRPKRRPRGEAGRQPNFDEDEPRGRGRRGGGGGGGGGGEGKGGGVGGRGNNNNPERKRLAQERAKRVMGGGGGDDDDGGNNQKLAMWKKAGREKRNRR